MPPRKRRLAQKKNTSTNGPVQVIRPLAELDPVLRKHVLDLAKGDATRVEIVSRTEAVVR